MGIDEAGYGPLLGPLVVSGAVFEVPDGQVETSLWELLAESVTGRPSRRDLRLPILDSKKLHTRSAGFGALERTALVMLQSSMPAASSLGDLLRHVAPHTLQDMAEYPWYASYDPTLPCDVEVGAISTQANAVRRNARAKGIRLAGVLCEPLLEGHYNRLVSNTRNKAVVLLGLTLRIIQRVLKRADGAPVRILVDRQGGRSHYARALMDSFEQFDLQILEESEERSAYRLNRAPSSHSIEFCTKGEDHHLPIALGSIYSKYLRELFMKGFNQYWHSRVADLRPTAGYYTDAVRFLGDIDEAVQREGIARGQLVRSR